jgi:glycosyltransferase involved in cell wall biosynthesis
VNRLAVSMTVEQLWQPAPGGSGTYIRELATALTARTDVALMGVRAFGRDDERKGLPDAMTIRQSRLPRAVLYALWVEWRIPGLPGPKPQVIHATTWSIPRRTAPLVVTVHDTAFLRNPDHFTPRGVSFFQWALGVTRREADAVVVPSRATFDDCVSAGIDPGLVTVIPHGVTALPVTDADIAAFRERRGLTRPYILWTGSIEPRKNLGVLLDAYADICHDTDLDLVLAGPDGWGGAAADLRARRAGLPADRVHVMGALALPELQAAYAGAQVYCYPSLWEGFGMPVLEAQAHGIPVVTSQDTAMAEFGGDGAILVDPQDPAAVAVALREAAGDRHDELSAAGLANAAKYTWAKSAELHMVAYRDAIEHYSTTRRGRRG